MKQFRHNEPFIYYWSKDLRWFRVFGYGIYAKHKSMKLSYAEKNKIRRLIKIGPWYIGFLHPIKF